MLKDLLFEEINLLNYVIDDINLSKSKQYTNQSKLRQSSVCMIFRMNPSLKTKVSGEYFKEYNRYKNNDFLDTLKKGYSLDSINIPNEFDHGIEIMFIKRAENERDRFSGQIAFPGGKCDNEEDDYEAATREASEECGLNLLDKSGYIHLGVLPKNFFVYPHPKGNLYVTAHLFWQIPIKEIQTKNNESEVAYCLWVPLRYILNPPISKLSLSKEYLYKLPEMKNYFLKQIAQEFSKGLNGGKAWKISLPNGDDLWGLTFMIFIFFMGYAFKAMKSKNMKNFDQKVCENILRNCLVIKLGQASGTYEKIRLAIAEYLFYNYRQKQFENFKNYNRIFFIIVLISSIFCIFWMKPSL